MKRIAVVGSRSYHKPALVREYLAMFKGAEVEIVSGGAPGVDTFAERYAKELGFPVKIFLPDWDRYGKGAGFIRNQQIVDHSDVLAAFWDGSSRGTKDSIDKALKAEHIQEVRIFK